VGQGVRQGTQSQLGFIPFRQTDFIFPVLAEEGGFVAAMLLLALYGCSSGAWWRWRPSAAPPATSC
jgi:cell division protein FtsW (lipid II flippase)